MEKENNNKSQKEKLLISNKSNDKNYKIDFSNPSHIPYKDKLLLTPVEKYRIYGKFPSRMFLDIALAILCTIQITMISGPTMEYTKAVERFLYDIFLQNDAISDEEFHRFKYIYTVKDLAKLVRNSRDSFFELDEKSFGNMTLRTTENATKILVNIDYINGDNDELMGEYNLTKEDSWIFNESYSNKEIKANIKNIKSFYIQYKMQTFEPYNFGDYYECFLWDIKQVFDFERRYHFGVSLDIDYCSCKDLTKNGNTFIKGCYWIPTFIIILSLIDLVLCVRSLLISYKYYLNFQYRYSKMEISIPKENNPSKFKSKSKWDMIRKKDKKKFFSSINYIQTFGNIIQLVSALLTLYEGDEVIVLTKYVVGISASLSYLTLMKYLWYYPNFQTILTTILKSIPYLIVYFIGTIPIFVSFIIVAIANFPYSERFYSFTRIILNLFGMMNGDSILDVIKDVIGNSFFIGTIYIYFFNILFICFVINIFVSIIEESFVTSKIKNQNHWIYSFVKKKKNPNEEKGNISRKEMRLFDEMRRKNLIRNVLRKEESDDINNNNEKGNDVNVMDLIKDFDKFFDMVRKDIETITNEIKESNECKMKHELKQYILKRINIITTFYIIYYFFGTTTIYYQSKFTFWITSGNIF